MSKTVLVRFVLPETGAASTTLGFHDGRLTGGGKRGLLGVPRQVDPDSPALIEAVVKAIGPSVQMAYDAAFSITPSNPEATVHKILETIARAALTALVEFAPKKPHSREALRAVAEILNLEP